MLNYDTPKLGNDYYLTKRNGRIVAMMGWQALSSEQRVICEPMRAFYVDEGSGELMALGVTPRDAVEAIRRYAPELSESILSGEAQLYCKVREPVGHEIPNPSA